MTEVKTPKINFGRFEATFKWRFVDKCFSWQARSKLKNRDFSIICNNCIAGGIYHRFGLPYSSPTVGLFFYLSDYINFLENFQYYLGQPLKFKDTSVHPEANELRKKAKYPVGVLGDDVEIHFLHYKNEDEASEKWTRRKKRINFEKLFFIYSDAGDFSEEYLERFKKLPFSNKIFFSAKPREGACVVFVRDYENTGGYGVGDSTRNRKYEKYVNIVKWLNEEKCFLK